MNELLKILMEIGIIAKDLFVEVGVKPLRRREEAEILVKLKEVQCELRKIYSYVRSAKR